MSHVRPFDAPPPPSDLRGTIVCARWNEYENATLIAMVRKKAYEAGYVCDTATETGEKAFNAFHEIDLLLTCIFDRVTAQAEMLDVLETSLNVKQRRRQ